ncbi:MAG: hypothetical protein MJZ65_00800 [Paludibacteraceae bacterium]|nr:hypothetical protein [Paludibacteraceae bacterium]
MKKYYITPQSEVMTFAPQEQVMTPQTLYGSPSMVEPTSAPMRKISVRYI